MAVVLAFVLIGQALEEILDPRLRERVRALPLLTQRTETP